MSSKIFQISKNTDVNKIGENGLLFTGKDTYISNAIPSVKFKIYFTKTDSTFIMAGINLEKSNILIRNYGIIDISFGHIIFIANTVNYDRMDSYLYYNLFNSITIGSSETKTLSIIYNKIEKGKDNSLFLNSGGSIELNSRDIFVFNNNVNSDNNMSSSLFYNQSGTMTLGSQITNKISINNNIINSDKYSYMFYNSKGGTITFSGKNINIQNNEITPTFELSGFIDKYSISIYNEGKISINLYGENPSFGLSNNTTTGKTDNVFVVLMINNNELPKPSIDFINNSNNTAKIKLHHDIRSFYISNDNDNYQKANEINSVFVLKNEIGHNGSFELGIGTSMIEVNEISIQSDTKFLFAINGSDLVGRLVGVGADSKLEISENKRLSIEIDNLHSKDIKTNKKYKIISGFSATDLEKLISDNKLILINDNKIISISGLSFDVSFYNSSDAISVVFTNIGEDVTIKPDITEDEDTNFDSNSPTKEEIEDELGINDKYSAIINIIIININGNQDNTINSILNLLKDKNISTDDKLSLLQDIMPDEQKDLVYETKTIVLEPIINTITERLNNNVYHSDSNLMLSYNDDDTKYYGIIKNSKYNNVFEFWSKLYYNYGYDFNNDKSLNSININLGWEYGIKDNKYNIGSSYTFSIGKSNNTNILANSISLYFGMNDISIMNFKNHFVNTILTYSRLNIKEVKNNNKLISINHDYDTNIISFDNTFGRNIMLNKDHGIITIMLGIRYNYMNRNNYENNINFNVNRLLVNMLSPSFGINYEKFLNKEDSLLFKTGIKLMYDINLNTEELNSVNVGFNYNNNQQLINYEGNKINGINLELSFGIKYEPNNKLSISLDTYGSYDTNNYMNVGVSIEGRWRIR